MQRLLLNSRNPVKKWLFRPTSAHVHASVYRMAVRKRHDPGDSTVGALLLLFAASCASQGKWEGSAWVKRPFWSSEHSAGRLVYFPGKPDGIWLACAEPKLGKSCWPRADVCVAMDVYRHLPLQAYQLKDQASWVNSEMLNCPWVQRKHSFCDVPACPPGPVLQHHTQGLVCPQAVCVKV